MKKQLFVIAILCSLCIAACKKNKPSNVLPPITQEGKNTVGFKVNGEVWTPYYPCRYFGNPCGEISASYGRPDTFTEHFGFTVSRKYGDKHSTLSIGGMEPINTVGNKYEITNIYFRGENSTGNTDTWSKSWSDLAPPGIFEITKIDMENQIISGVFSFTLYEDNGSGNSIEITDGRFDFKMNACICR